MTYGADLAPDFDLQVEGVSAGKSGPLFDAIRPLITEVSWEEDEDKAGLLTLIVANQPAVEYGRAVNWRAVVDSKVFSEGNSIDIYMGYGGYQVAVGRGEIVRWLPEFPSDGPAAFTIKAYDGRHKMGVANAPKSRKKKGKRKTYYKGPDSATVQAVAAKYGYGAVVDATSTIRTRVQTADTSDWKFLRRIADDNFFDLWVDWDVSRRRYVVNFKKRVMAGTPTYEFVYRGKDGSLLEAFPEFVVSEQPTNVDVLFFDTRSTKVGKAAQGDTQAAEKVKLPTSGYGQITAQKAITAGARVRFSAFGQTYEVTRDKPFASKADASKAAQGWLQERERDLLMLRGTVVGLPGLRPRQFHKFIGLGARVDGLYRLTSTRQVMKAGSLWSCEVVGHKVPDDTVVRGAPSLQTVS